MADRAARPAAAALERLDAITRRLRRECPWDREQDERSIVPHTVEEAYELADAAATGDDEKLLDELGDVLFQVHFLSLLLEERGGGSLASVADACREKLIRRHPHVFGDVEAETAGEVRRNWDEIKRTTEGRGGAGLFADVPGNLPSLLYARKVLRRAERVGRSADRTAALEHLKSGFDRLAQPGDGSREELEATIGETLLAVVELATAAGVDPELALRAATKGRERWIDEDVAAHE
ncbi:MAG TPA: MazG nucleotide pyrophosphohydrolase domain-containing protein [Thermoleophilaceae bacterium]|nr:MazG nucleotide pyrophosphohydrolase domain-containing protein [Thermoleophilaceae bacterium]